jgi:PAS domain S-box-containing protein
MAAHQSLLLKSQEECCHLKDLLQQARLHSASVNDLAKNRTTSFAGEREDLKRVEDILHDREARLQAIFSNAAVGIVTVNLQGKLLQANKKFLSMLGYSVEDLSRLNYLDITFPEDRPLSTQYFNQLVSGQINTYHLEKRYLRKEGQFFWGNVFTTLVRDTLKNFEVIVAIIVDISKRKCAEEALKQAHERFMTILDSINSIVYVVDIKTCEILFANQYAKQFFNHSLEGAICWEVIQNNQKEPCPFCPNDKLLTPEGIPTGEVYVWEQLNSVVKRWLYIQDTAIYWTDGRLVRLQIATDISTRKEMEDELQKSTARLAEAQ